jgi:hypothetical protein
MLFWSGHMEIVVVSYVGVCGSCRYFFAGLSTIRSQEANNLQIQ